MPLFIQAKPVSPVGRNIFPDPAKYPQGWPDSRIRDVLNFAQISSAKSKNTRTTREVIWVCADKRTRREPIVLWVFSAGQIAFPKGKAGHMNSKRALDIFACLERSQSACSRNLPQSVDGKTVIKGRRRKVLIECPVAVSPAATPPKTTRGQAKRKLKPMRKVQPVPETPPEQLPLPEVAGVTEE